MTKKIECSHCSKKETKTRIVIERKPLVRLVLPDDEYDEFYCTNIIKHRKKGSSSSVWIEEECRNRTLIKKKYLKDEGR